jgi:hypothetical protein
VDVTHGFYDVVRGAFALSPIELEGREEVEADRHPAAPHGTPEEEEQAIGALSARLVGSASFQELDEGVALHCGYFPGAWFGVGCNLCFAECFMSATEQLHYLQTHHLIPLCSLARCVALRRPLPRALEPVSRPSAFLVGPRLGSPILPPPLPHIQPHRARGPHRLVRVYLQQVGGRLARAHHGLL